MDYTLKLSASELRVVADALERLPYRKVAAVMLKIGGQAADQEKAANEDADK
jgi:hypothetical protein